MVIKLGALGNATSERWLPVDWSAKLKEWRQKKRFTQEDAAHFLGVSVRTYQKWEQGKTAMNDAAKALCRLALREGGIEV